VRFEVSTAVRMMMTFFWVLAPCRLVGIWQRFGETHCHTHGSVYQRLKGTCYPHIKDVYKPSTLNFGKHLHDCRGSSGSIESDYGLDDRAIEVRSPTGAEDFSSSPCVQTGSRAHPASYPMGTGVLSPWVKRGRGVTLTTHPHLVPRLIMSRSYTSSPPMRLHGV
jgi:hypothetical protein